jgi:hypothetical protein
MAESESHKIMAVRLSMVFSKMGIQGLNLWVTAGKSPVPGKLVPVPDIFL